MAFNRNRNGGGDRGGFRPRPSFGGSPRFAGGAGGRGGFGGRDRGDRGPVEMHDAICDNCGKSCQVPFRPTSGKPIFCSECFEQKRGGSEPRYAPQPQPQNNRQLEEVNAKLDKILSLLEKPEKKAKVKKVEEATPVVEELS